MSIFKANDIRALYPEDWNRETAYKIGLSLAEIFEGSKIVIGRDGRTTSLEIVEAVIQGLVEKGITVSDVGMVDTPAVYFAVGEGGYDGGIMITASHNPVGYNGIKIIGKNAAPFDFNHGMKKLEFLVHQQKQSGYMPKEIQKKFLEKLQIREKYVQFISKFQGDYSGTTAVFDCSNGMAGVFIHDILEKFTGEAIVINDTIDGLFPAHGPNPSRDGSLKELKQHVINSEAVVGFCFDGDADRVVVIDEAGRPVSPDIITALLGGYFLETCSNTERSNCKILVDIRSSDSVSEYLSERGGIPIPCPVGHAKIKEMMRKEHAVCAGELTGHYYYRDNYYCDSAWITVFVILDIIAGTGEHLSAYSSRIMKYEFSGEISFPMSNTADQEQVIRKLFKLYPNAQIDTLDGYRFNFSDWWFIVRKSGTEPLLRLVVETKGKGALHKKVAKLRKEIQKIGL